MRFPPLPEVPGQLRAGLHAGGGGLPRRRRRRCRDLAAAAPARPRDRHLRHEPRSGTQPAAHGSRSAGPLPGRRRIARRPSRAAIDALLALAGPDAQTPLASIEVRHLGGALARPAPGGGAQTAIDARYTTYAGGAAPTAELAAVLRAGARAVNDALTPWHASYNYYNLTETPADADAVLPPASYYRLQQIQARYDPTQAIISAHPIRPAGH